MRTVVIAMCMGVLGAATLVPVPELAAQCQWGCRCVEDSCGCNKRGNGRSCDASGDGCVVQGCGSDGDLTPHGVAFAPDGSPVALPSAGERVGGAGAPLLAGLRWEDAGNDMRIGRDCAGTILARRYGAALAAEIRRRDGELIV